MVAREAGADDCEILFIKRTEAPDDPWSGHMALPGGRVEADDDGALAAAIRETREEVAIDLARSGVLLGRIDEIAASARGRRIPLVITPFVFELVEPATPRANPAEVEEMHWVRASLLRDPRSATSVPYVFEGRRFELPGIEVAGRVIWGLTYQMLMRLFTALQWELPPLPAPEPPHAR